jgi:hypothetical protein
MTPTRQSTLIQSIVEAAEAWSAEDFGPRREAVEKTLEAPNRFTEKGLEYALNHHVGRLTRDVLEAWLEGRWTDDPSAVGVLAASEVPFDALRDAVAVWGTGHRFVGHTSEASPYLLPAFTETVAQKLDALGAGGDGQSGAALRAEFVDEDRFFDAADAVIAQPPPDAADAVRAQCEEHGIPEARRHIRPPVYSVGVIDGNESEEEREDLAADMLLHEGMGRPRLALLWAPRDLKPDPYLEAMAQFRGAVPAHPDTPGALQMQKAFLEARDVSHAYATGLQFLMSRAEPEVQQPGHIRWTEYDALADVRSWLDEHAGELYALIARPALHDRLPDVAPTLAPGQAHGAPIDDEEGEAVVEFLAGL